LWNSLKREREKQIKKERKTQEKCETEHHELFLRRQRKGRKKK
jgi:hypothetical protein